MAIPNEVHYRKLRLLGSASVAAPYFSISGLRLAEVFGLLFFWYRWADFFFEKMVR